MTNKQWERHQAKTNKIGNRQHSVLFLPYLRDDNRKQTSAFKIKTELKK